MIGKVRQFFSEIKVEMSKVTWSTREELINSTVIVLTTMAFLAVFVGICDFVFSQVVTALFR